MTELTIDIDTSEIDALIRKFPALERVIFDEIESTMRSSLGVLEEQISGRTPVNSGALRGSITQSVVGASPQLTGIVGTQIPYGLPVEHGRQPGKQPPIDVIEFWVRRKLGVSAEDARSVAFLVARAIGRRGTKGQKMFEKGFEAAERPIIKLWQSLPGRVVPKMERLID